MALVAPEDDIDAAIEALQPHSGSIQTGGARGPGPSAPGAAPHPGAKAQPGARSPGPAAHLRDTTLEDSLADASRAAPPTRNWMADAETPWLMGGRPADWLAGKHGVLLQLCNAFAVGGAGFAAKIEVLRSHVLASILVLVELVQRVYAFAVFAAAHADHAYKELEHAREEMAGLRRRIAALEQRLYDSDRRAAAARPLPIGAAGGDAMLVEPSAPLPALERRIERTEAEATLQRLNQCLTVIKLIKQSLLCPICGDVAVLPKVLGACGHVACHACLKSLDENAFAQLTSHVGGASARQHLLARRCPLCRTEIIGSGFPSHPHKEVARVLILNGFVDAAELSNWPRGTDFKVVKYEVETTEARHIAALQLGCYAQSQLAEHSVLTLEQVINGEQWRRGVYVVFENSVARVFFETFAMTLQGKAGGVQVSVNASQRMLAVQLVDRTKDKSDHKAGGQHLLVRVGTDGRYTITAAPDPAANRPPIALDQPLAPASTFAPTVQSTSSLARPEMGSAPTLHAVPPAAAARGPRAGARAETLRGDPAAISLERRSPDMVASAPLAALAAMPAPLSAALARVAPASIAVLAAMPAPLSAALARVPAAVGAAPPQPAAAAPPPAPQVSLMVSTVSTAALVLGPGAAANAAAGAYMPACASASGGMLYPQPNAFAAAPPPARAGGVTGGSGQGVHPPGPTGGAVAGARSPASASPFQT
jgi:RING-type zinc-finger